MKAKVKKLALKLDEIWARQMDTINRDDPENYDSQVEEAILQAFMEVAEAQKEADKTHFMKAQFHRQEDPISLFYADATVTFNHTPLVTDKPQ